MSEQNALAFVEKVKTDTNLQGGLQGLIGNLLGGNGDVLQQVVDFAKRQGFDFLKPELEKILGGTDLTALLGQSGLLAGLKNQLGGADVGALLGGFLGKK
jgi:hypothetical protein